MKNSMHIREHHLQYSSVRTFIPSEMRQQIPWLEREFDEYDGRLSGYLDILDSIQKSIEIAQQTARCLLMNDPFAAWQEIARQRQKRRYAVWGRATAEEKNTESSHQARANEKKLITPQMLRQIVEAQKTLDEFASCLGDFFNDVINLKSLDTAMGCAEDLQCWAPLEDATAVECEEKESD